MQSLLIILIFLFVCVLAVIIYNFFRRVHERESLHYVPDTRVVSLRDWHKKLGKRAVKVDPSTVNRFVSFPILCIHLERSSDRAKHIQEQTTCLVSLPLLKIPAIDGRDIDTDKQDHVQIDEFEFDASSLIFAETSTKKAMIACLLSHLRAIHYAWRKNLDTVCICEDDVSFFLLPHWSRTWKEIVQEAPRGWEMILLYNNGVDISISSDLHYIKASPGNGTVAYLISKKGQKKIASLFDENARFTKIPLAFSSFFIADYFLYKFLSPHVYALSLPMVYPFNEISECNSLIHRDHLMYHQSIAKTIIEFYDKKMNEMAQSRFRLKPPLWSCWTDNNPIPPYIQMCHETIKKYNEPYFQVILVTPENIHHFLQDLHPSYKNLSHVHKADYLRVQLLYHYGGIYLGIDTIGLSPLRDELHISKNVDEMRYGDKQWSSGSLRPVKDHNAHYKIRKTKQEMMLTQKEEMIKQFHQQNPEDQDGLKWASLTRDLFSTNKPSSENSLHVTKNQQSDYLTPDQLTKSVSDRFFHKIIRSPIFKCLPVILLNNTMYSSRIKKYSRDEIFESDLLLFRLMRHALEKPYIFAYPFIDKIFYINLDHRLDRKRETVKELSEYFRDEGILRIPGIPTPANGHYGCLQSHIRCLEYAKTNFPGNNVLICEDDVEFMMDPRPIIDNFFRDPTTHDWDVLLLNHSKEDLFIKKKTASTMFVRVLETQSACCYLVRGSYVLTLLRLFQDTIHEYHTSKVWKVEYCVDQCWKQLHKKYKWYAYRQRVAKQRKSFSDTEHRIYEYFV